MKRFEELEQVLQRIRRIKPGLEKHYGICKIGVFGSYARGDQHGQSDIDLIVELSRPVGLLKLIRAERYLSSELGRPVDLLTVDSLKPYMKDMVLKEVVYA